MAKKKSDPSGNSAVQPTGTIKRAGQFLKMMTSIAQTEVSSRIKNRDNTQIRLIQAAALVRELGNLKGAAMKVGQMLALEARDYLPDEVIAVLEQLQNKVTFMPYATVEDILKKDLGQRAALLTDMSREPIAAASIGQVHRAKYQGQDVAVKIQYPGIRDSIRSDIKILGTTMKGLKVIFRRDVDLDGLLDEFGEVFLQETDYIQEAVAAEEYRRAAEPVKNIIVPQIFSEVSDRHVLTMSFEAGTPLSQWIRENRSATEVKQKLGATILDLYTREFCDWGLVQTDPNPGNFLIRPHTHELILLDFGATKRFSPDFRRRYSQLVLAIFNQDKKAVREISIAMELISPRENEKAFEVFETLVFESMRPLTLPRFNFNDHEYVTNIRNYSRQLVVELKHSPPPRDLIFLHRKLGGIFQMLRQLEIELELGGFLTRFKELAAE